MRKSLFLIAAGGTTTTFTVTNGTLTITTPDSVNLGSGAPGTAIGPTALGTVTVNDNPAIAIAVPVSAIVGLYSGTITHSVS
jgi:hypothetical protein